MNPNRRPAENRPRINVGGRGETYRRRCPEGTTTVERDERAGVLRALFSRFSWTPTVVAVRDGIADGADPVKIPWSVASKDGVTFGGDGAASPTAAVGLLAEAAPSVRWEVVGFVADADPSAGSNGPVGETGRRRATVGQAAPTPVPDGPGCIPLGVALGVWGVAAGRLAQAAELAGRLGEPRLRGSGNTLPPLLVTVDGEWIDDGSWFARLEPGREWRPPVRVARPAVPLAPARAAELGVGLADFARWAWGGGAAGVEPPGGAYRRNLAAAAAGWAAVATAIENGGSSHQRGADPPAGFWRDYTVHELVRLVRHARGGGLAFLACAVTGCPPGGPRADGPGRESDRPDSATWAEIARGGDPPPRSGGFRPTDAAARFPDAWAVLMAWREAVRAAGFPTGDHDPAFPAPGDPPSRGASAVPVPDCCRWNRRHALAVWRNLVRTCRRAGDPVRELFPAAGLGVWRGGGAWREHGTADPERLGRLRPVFRGLREAAAADRVGGIDAAAPGVAEAVAKAKAEAGAFSGAAGRGRRAAWWAALQRADAARRDADRATVRAATLRAEAEAAAARLRVAWLDAERAGRLDAMKAEAAEAGFDSHS